MNNGGTWSRGIVCLQFILDGMAYHKMWKIVKNTDLKKKLWVNILWMNDNEQRNYEAFTRKNVWGVNFLDADKPGRQTWLRRSQFDRVIKLLSRRDSHPLCLTTIMQTHSSSTCAAVRWPGPAKQINVIICVDTT